MIDPLITMFLIVFIGAAASFIVKFGIYEVAGMNKVMDESKNFQKEMKDVNKRYLDAIKAGKPEKAVELESEVNQMFFKLLKIQLKIFIFTIPIIFLYRGLLGWVTSAFVGFTVHFPFELPVPHIGGPEWITWTDNFGPRGWFWLSFLAVSMLAARKRESNKKKRGE